MKAKCRLIAMLLAVVMISSICGFYGTAAQDPSDMVKWDGADGEAVAENSGYAMYVNHDTAVVWVVNKANGYVWSTNPLPDELNQITNTAVKASLSSQITVSYYNASETLASMDNYTESIAKNQFEIYQIKNGIKIVFSMGMMSALQMVPDVISEKDMTQLLSSLPETDQKLVLSYYSLIQYSALSSALQSSMLKKYPTLKNENLYVVRELSDRVKQQLDVKFKAAGLTQEKLEGYYKALKYEPKVDPNPCFVVPVEYSLDEDGLRVSVPTQEIEYDRTNFVLSGINLLNHFGTAKAGTEGYMMVPDGSGAVINFDNSSKSIFYKEIYGTDNSFINRPFSGYSASATLPVFGMVKGNNGFLCVIEESESVAAVTAATSAQATGYAYVGSSFTVNQREEYPMSSSKGGTVVKYTKNINSKPLQQKYYFLSGSNASYSGMANLYRDILFNGRQKAEKEDNQPFYLESIGLITKQKKFLGLSLNAKVPLTTFSQAETILTELANAGITNVKYKLSGSINGGMDYTAPTAFRICSQLGGKKAFSHLQEFAAKQGASLYPNVDFNYVVKKQWFSGFSTMKHGARALDGTVAQRCEYNLGSLENLGENPKYIISPQYFTEYAEKFSKQYAAYHNPYLSVEALASDLNSDFNEKKPFDRPSAQQETVKALQKLSGAHSLLAQNANAYALPYLQYVVGEPLDNSSYYMEDDSIPFVQMVLHGYVHYSGEALNLAENYTYSFLKAVETGSGLYYILNYADSSILKNTRFSYLYSTNYTTWTEDAAERYAALNELYQLTGDALITGHAKLAENVYETGYSNGVKVYVNYSSEAAKIGTLVVPAHDYVYTK